MPSPDTAAQVARLREIIDGEQYQESGDRDILSAAADALEREAGLVADAERLTYIIDESLNGEDWFKDGVWDRASDFYSDDENPQRAIRAAIDAARSQS